MGITALSVNASPVPLQRENSYLWEVLGHRSPLPVRIPHDDEEFQVGVCNLGEPAHTFLAAYSRVHLVAGPTNKYRNRTVDLLFTSAAAHAGPCALGSYYPVL